MKNTTRAAIAATLVGLALPLHAEELLDKRPYLSPMFAYTFADSNRGSDDGIGFSFAGGFVVNKYWNVELSSFLQEFDSKNGAGAEWRDSGAKVDGLFFYSRNPSFSPYFGLGLGYQRTDLKDTGLTDTQPLVDAGLGFFKYFNVGERDFAIRADARYRWTSLDEIKNRTGVDDLSEPVIRVGVVVPLGPKTVVASAADPAPAKTPAAPAKVLDSDGDGIPDAKDRCPGSARGAPVDAYGCTKEQLAAGSERQFDDELFAFDKSELTPEGMAILDSAATTVNAGEYKALRINISGHTDWVGSEGYNQALSERRANVVKAYLVKKGVDASRIRTFAFGETTPVADNDTDDGRAKNRRAEVRTTAGE